MTEQNTFVDYYKLLGISPSSERKEILDGVRTMYKQWHPDVCRDTRAHEMTILIGEAKEFLLDDAKRQDYDRMRIAYLAGETSASNYNEWQYEQEWRKESEQARARAQQAASLKLEDLLIAIVGVAAEGVALAATAAVVGTAYAWQGADGFSGRESKYTFAQQFWCGIAGWACVVCLAVPGTSIVTFFCFYWAFFPGPAKKFVGLGTVLKGMALSAVIVLPVAALLFAAIVNRGR